LTRKIESLSGEREGQVNTASSDGSEICFFISELHLYYFVAFFISEIQIPAKKQAPFNNAD